MANIDTLVEDIYGLFSDDDTAPFSERSTREFAERLSQKICNRIAEGRVHGRLRLSNLGTPCRRQLYYRINAPDEAEPLSPEARIKFLFGDILEEMLLWLAKEAGHEVTDEQKEVDLYGVKGHIDGRIDGVLVDVKSASSFSFDKFKSHLSPDADGFGYLTQLDAYQHADSNEDVPGREGMGGFLVIDKTLGKICLDKHPRSGVNYEEKVREIQDDLGREVPPPRGFAPVPEGKSGNERLDVVCSYCAFKKKCYPGLRTFIYSGGPKFLTKVVRTPDVPEL